MTTPQTREERETRFLKDFRAGKFVNQGTGLQNPFKIETWWDKELTTISQRVREEALREVKEIIKEELLNAVFEVQTGKAVLYAEIVRRITPSPKQV